MSLSDVAVGVFLGVLGTAYYVGVSDVNLPISDDYRNSIDNGTLTVDQRVELIKEEIPLALCELEDNRRYFVLDTQESTSEKKQRACAEEVKNALSASYAPI